MRLVGARSTYQSLASLPQTVRLSNEHGPNYPLCMAMVAASVCTIQVCKAMDADPENPEVNRPPTGIDESELGEAIDLSGHPFTSSSR